MGWYNKRYKTHIFFVAFTLMPLFGILFTGCASNGGSVSIGPPSSIHAAKPPVLSRCQNTSSPIVTSLPSSETQETLYFAASSQLYAVNALNGVVRWCIQARLTLQSYCSGSMSCPPSSTALFGSPTIESNTLYVCAPGYTYALNKDDGSVRWHVPTQCALNSIPFEDYAAPIVKDGIVYSSSYALREQDGTVLWQFATASQNEGSPSPQVLVHNVIYANTEESIYAIDTKNGHILWRYTPDTQMPIGGHLVVDGVSLFVGTLGSVDHPELSRFYALDVRTGKLRWQYAMGDYAGAVVHNDTIYVSSRDQHLYAIDKNTGSLRWKRNFLYPTYNVATSVGNMLYINIDGAYALQNDNGTIIWYKALGSSPSVDFIPSSVVGNIVYLASIDGYGHSILYALNSSNGDEYWQSSYPYQLTPIMNLRSTWIIM